MSSHRLVWSCLIQYSLLISPLFLFLLFTNLTAEVTEEIEGRAEERKEEIEDMEIKKEDEAMETVEGKTSASLLMKQDHS